MEALKRFEMLYEEVPILLADARAREGLPLVNFFGTGFITPC